MSMSTPQVFEQSLFLFKLRLYKIALTVQFVKKLLS